MSPNVLPVEIRAVVPASAGRAVFIGNDDKVFVIYVDRGVGDAIHMFLNGTLKERPLTHDLIGTLLTAFGARVQRVVINDIEGSTYFARIIVTAENELMEQKIVELDARPSDSIAMALQQKAPIFVARTVWEEVEDMSEILRRLEAGEHPQEEGEPSSDEDDEDDDTDDEEDDDTDEEDDDEN